MSDALLTTNQLSAELPFQRWYRFKEAFSPRFVTEAVKMAGSRLGRRVRTCCDPFGGSGTTALTCQFLGILPITIEVNPFLADLIESKLTSYRLTDLSKAWNSVRARLDSNASDRSYRECQRGLPEAPATFVEPGHRGRWIFDRAVARRVLLARDAIEAIPDEPIARLFRVLLGSTLVSVSNVVVSGKGRRYRAESRRGGVLPGEVDVRLEDAVTRAAEDITHFGSRKCLKFTVIRGDARTELEGVGEVDLHLFSPPYPNSFDYTDIYNLELWCLGYLNSAKQNTELRNATLRSHVQVLRDFHKEDLESPSLRKVRHALSNVGSSLWNPHIPEMVNAYFADLLVVLEAAGRRLSNRGSIMMVVGDSKYAGVHVDVARIVMELAPTVGLQVEKPRPVRSMRTSAQQGGSFGLQEWLLVLRRLPGT